MELGIGMFGDVSFDNATAKYRDAETKLQEILEQVQVMDQVGLDVFAMGEHHRADYVVPSPEILLAAAASVTKNIKLASGVTVLSSAEPVKVYEDFSMLDLISKGRAEVIVGRGSFIESFPLYGYSLGDYEELFEEKLDLLLKINNEENVTWKGRLRPSMSNQTVFPRAKRPLPIWIAVGGTPTSILRAATLGLPLIVAIIGGMPKHFKDLIAFYKQEYLAAGHDPEKIQVAIHSHTFVSEDPKVIDQYFHHYKAQMDRIGASRGWSPYTQMQYEGGKSREGALFIGNTDEVAEKIQDMKELFGITRFIGHMDVGDPTHEMMLKSIELFGDKVAPLVR